MCKTYLHLEKLHIIYHFIHVYCIHVHLLSIHDCDVVTLHHAFESHALDKYPHFSLEMPASIFVPSLSPSTSATIHPNLFSDISRHCNHKETRSLNRFRTGQICGTIYKYVRVHMRINRYIDIEREREIVANIRQLACPRKIVNGL